jgi:hypothetical protein
MGSLIARLTIHAQQPGAPPRRRRGSQRAKEPRSVPRGLLKLPKLRLEPTWEPADRPLAVEDTGRRRRPVGAGAHPDAGAGGRGVERWGIHPNGIRIAPKGCHLGKLFRQQGTPTSSPGRNTRWSSDDAGRLAFRTEFRSVAPRGRWTVGMGGSRRAAFQVRLHQARPRSRDARAPRSRAKRVTRWDSAPVPSKAVKALSCRSRQSTRRFTLVGEPSLG